MEFSVAFSTSSSCRFYLPRLRRGFHMPTSANKRNSMKRLIQLSVLTLAGTLAQSAHAYYTNFLDTASNTLATVYAGADAFPDAQKIVGKAVKDLSKKSTSVAGDYNIFIAASTHLLPLNAPHFATNENLTNVIGLVGTTMTNTFNTFVTNALEQYATVAADLATVSEFQPIKRAASNNLEQAFAAIIRPSMTTNIQEGILSIRLAYSKLAVARKLVDKALAKPGFAPNSLTGAVLEHSEKASDGTITFTDDTNFTSDEGDGKYTYDRTGLNTAQLVLLYNVGTRTNTANLKFSSDTKGKFTFSDDNDGDIEKGSGSFTLTP